VINMWEVPFLMLLVGHLCSSPSIMLVGGATLRLPVEGKGSASSLTLWRSLRQARGGGCRYQSKILYKNRHGF